MNFFKKEICLNNSNYFKLSLAYLAIPVVVFFFGYLKLIWAVLFAGMLIAGVLYSARNIDKSEDALVDGIKINIGSLLVITLITLILLVIAGIGEFTWVSSDHAYRYAILNDLVHYKWPIIYDFSTQTNAINATYLGSGTAAFAYYFTFWMVPALIGKLCGLMAARIAILIWSTFGMVLVLLGINLIYKKFSLFLSICVFAFAGFDAIPYFLRLVFMPEVFTTYERWTTHFVIAGNYFQLCNVFNQCIPGWIIAILLISLRDNKSIGLLGGLMFCYSPWATIGMVPMCIYKLISLRDKRTDVLKQVIGFFTLGNLLGPIAALIPMGTLYMANSNATSDNGFIWNFYSSIPMLIHDYIWLIIFEVAIWVAIIYKKCDDKPLLITAVATVMIIPVYKISETNDFVMRGTMIPMFYIGILACMFVTDNYIKMMKDKKKFLLDTRLALLAILVASFVAVNMVVLSLGGTIQIINGEDHSKAYDINSFGDINGNDYTEVINTQFFVHDYENTVFFKYLAR